MDERFTTIAGRTVRYLERPGEGPVLLMLHGLGDSADQFERVAERLPGDWRLLAFDQRGHGGSFRPEAGYAPFDFANDAIAYLDALDLAAVHVFGHSMGGRNALLLAAREPARTRSLILGDIGPDANPDDIRATRAFFDGLPDSFTTPAEARSHWRDRKPGYPEENIDLLMRNLETAPDGPLRWRFSKAACIAAVTAARSRDWWEFPGQVVCPVLLLHVEGSTELPDHVAERMRSEFSDVQYVRILGCGHNFHLESPTRAAEAIRRFVDAVEARDG